MFTGRVYIVVGECVGLMKFRFTPDNDFNYEVSKKIN